MPPTGAFIFGWEYGTLTPSPPYGIRSRDFPPRPQRFKLTRFAAYECLGPSYMLRFRVAGRYFQIHVALGHKASIATRAKVPGVLDSFKAKRV